MDPALAPAQAQDLALDRDRGHWAQTGDRHQAAAKAAATAL